PALRYHLSGGSGAAGYGCHVGTQSCRCGLWAFCAAPASDCSEVRHPCASHRPLFLSTKRCHVCGFINHAITLRDRLWTCPCCGTTHQRDQNAAANIYQEGASSCLQGRCKTTSVAATA